MAGVGKGAGPGVGGDSLLLKQPQESYGGRGGAGGGVRGRGGGGAIRAGVKVHANVLVMM